MTLESCATFCSGFKYFATEYASECYCGNSLDPSASPALLLDDCNMPCSGNPSAQYCGGPNRLELYVSEDVSTPATPSHPATVGDKWTFLTCLTESTAGRALSAKTFASDALTLEACGEFCEGHEFFGAQYGRECYCGDGPFGAGAEEVEEGECGMACAGDGGELCGAGMRLSVYARGD